MVCISVGWLVSHPHKGVAPASPVRPSARINSAQPGARRSGPEDDGRADTIASSYSQARERREGRKERSGEEGEENEEN